MSFPPKTSHSENCSCCWIMGYGVDEKRPNDWAEEIYYKDEECVDHGSEVSGASEFSPTGWV